MLRKNQQINEETKKAIRKYLETNEKKKKKILQNLPNTAKAVYFFFFSKAV